MPPTVKSFIKSGNAGDGKIWVNITYCGIRNLYYVAGTGMLNISENATTNMRLWEDGKHNILPNAIMNLAYHQPLISAT